MTSSHYLDYIHDLSAVTTLDLSTTSNLRWFRLAHVIHSLALSH
jgi:hypothetical protein